MSDTIQDLYSSFSEQMEPIQEDDRYFRYLFELAQASDTTIEQRREELEKVVDEEWLNVIEETLPSINAIIEKPRRFITTEEEVVPVSLARKISADSVRHLAQNTQFLASSDDGGIHPTRILNVSTRETYDLYENRFVYHLIKRLLAFVDKRTDVIFWSTGNEICNRFKMHSKIDDAYEEIEYTVELAVKNRQSFAENDADNVGTFMRIDRVRRLVMSLGKSSFCQLMNGCASVHSPIQRTNLMIKDPDYRACYKLWQFMERYDEVGYTINVHDSQMAVDDEYMIQMYTNLINNYAVFKSLGVDDRDLDELEGADREPVRPKFVKELKEELVADPDLPDVEIRRVFVEEVTQAQLDAEAALEAERAQGEELRARLEAMQAEVNALTDERDLARREAAEARDAEGTARAEAAAAVEAARAEADEKVAGARAEADTQVAEAQASAAAQVAEARAAADAQVAEAQASAADEIAEARDAAAAEVAAAQAAADEQVAAALADAEASVAAAQDEARCKVEEAQAACDQRLASEKAQADDLLGAAKASLDEKCAELENLRAANAAELAAAKKAAAAELEAALAKASEEREAEVASLKSDMQGRISALIYDLEKTKRARDRAQRRAEISSLSHRIAMRLRGLEVDDKDGDDVDDED